MANEPTPPPAQSAATAPASRTEPLAIWGLVLSILSWFGCLFLTVIPAIVCGHIARSRIRKSNGALQGKNLAVVALIVGYLNIPFGILGGIMLADMIRSDRARVHDLDVQKKEIAADDNKSKITVSGHWVKRTDLNQKATLQAACPGKEMYVIVISDAKSTVPKMTLEQHNQLTRDHMLQTMKNSSASQPVSLSIDNHPALQEELSGTDKNGANVVLLNTSVDDGENFHQVLAWTLKSRWQSLQQELRNATESFHSEK